MPAWVGWVYSAPVPTPSLEDRLQAQEDRTTNHLWFEGADRARGVVYVLAWHQFPEARPPRWETTDIPWNQALRKERPK